MEYENKYASKGISGTALGLGAGALGIELLRGGLGGIFGGENTVTRREADQAAKIAELSNEVKLRDSNIYTDGKILDLYRYIDGKIGCVESQIAAQSVVNAQVTANLSCLQATVNNLSALTKTVIPIGNICPEPATSA